MPLAPVTAAAGKSPADLVPVAAEGFLGSGPMWRTDAFGGAARGFGHALNVYHAVPPEPMWSSVCSGGYARGNPWWYRPIREGA